MVAESTKPIAIADKLLDALSGIGQPGHFCVSGDLPMTMPGLDVKGLGPVTLPLNRTQAKKLIQCCRQAPYGQGSDTIVDTDVRRVWELDPQQFQLTGPEWDSMVTAIVEGAQAALGLNDVKLNIDIYKMLLYEKGSFFLPHRDGEKLDGMVATLVIGLPSKYTGGELIVSHNGTDHKVVMDGAASGHELSYAAFYADCEHEIRPLKSGYRLCLVYNVSLAKSRGKRRGKAISASSNEPRTDSVTELIKRWVEGDGAHKFAITLQHRYTKGGLKRDALKGTDRNWADVVFAAAEQADCYAYLAQLTRFQNGMPSNWYELEQRAHGHFVSGSWDEEKDGPYRGKASYEDIYEESLSLDGWSDCDGKPVRFGQIDLSEKEIIADPPFSKWAPSREEIEGYTGNEGVTAKRWYHRAAIVVWPRDNQYSVLCDAGTAAAIGGLEQMTSQLDRGSKSGRSERLSSCVSFAEAIIDTWKPAARRNSWDSDINGIGDESSRAEFPQILSVIDSPQLGSRYLTEVLRDDAEQQIDKSFVAFIKRHGWNNFETALLAVITATTDATLSRNTRLVEMIATLPDKNADRIAVGQLLSNRLVARLEAVDQGSAKSAIRPWMRPTVDRSKLLTSLVKGLVSLSADEALQRLIDHTLGSEQYDLTDCHVAAIGSLESWLTGNLKSSDASSSNARSCSTAIENWLKGCRSRLEDLTSSAPEAPTDFRRADTVTCTCGDCAALKAFLVNPTEQVGRFPLAKQRRQHLHQIIQRQNCDTTHTTDRRGSPQTLVCTKTTTSYDAACKLFKRDSANLMKIIAFAEKLK